MKRKDDPRRSYAYQVASRKWLEKHSECALCGLPLDFDAEPRTRWYPTVDHILAIDNGGTNEQHNWQPAHTGCNSRKGNRQPQPSPRSRRW